MCLVSTLSLPWPSLNRDLSLGSVDLSFHRGAKCGALLDQIIGQKMKNAVLGENGRIVVARPILKSDHEVVGDAVALDALL
jgi:hypothetical protein